MHRCQLFCRNQGIYLDEYMQVGWHWLFHDEGACRIKAGLLIYSGNQWSGFNMRGTSVMKESRCTSPIIHRKSVLTCCKAEFAFLFCFFFYLTFLSQIFTTHRTAGEGKGYLLISFLPLPPTSQTIRHYPSYCCRELTSVHSWQPDLNRKPLVHAL